MAKLKKTNAMRILDREKIDYEILIYDLSDEMADGVSVALKTNQDVETVFKTLVTQGTSKNYSVFVIPVADELDLKKAAIASGEKKIEMIPQKDLLKISGYIKGGCSPIGMKKQFKTYIHNSAKNLDKIVFSGGKKGMQIKLAPNLLIKVTSSEFHDITKF